MAGKHASIKLSRDLVDEARRHAEVMHRSVGAQVEHWARIGQALESLPGIGVHQVQAALEGRLRIEDLTVEQQEAFFDRLGDAFNQPSPEVEAYYAQLGAREGAVGADADGRLVRRMADGNLKPLS